MAVYDYRVIVALLSVADGGGFIATVPELPGCMSDGETPNEAINNAYDAINAWIEAAHDNGREVPSPNVRQYA